MLRAGRALPASAPSLISPPVPLSAPTATRPLPLTAHPPFSPYPVRRLDRAYAPHTSACPQSFRLARSASSVPTDTPYRFIGCRIPPHRSHSIDFNRYDPSFGSATAYYPSNRQKNNNLTYNKLIQKTLLLSKKIREKFVRFHFLRIFALRSGKPNPECYRPRPGGGIGRHASFRY